MVNPSAVERFRAELAEVRAELPELERLARKNPRAAWPKIDELKVRLTQLEATVA